MRKFSFVFILSAFLIFDLFFVHPCRGDSLILITPDEASQPDAPMIRTRGIKLTKTEGYGPQIKIYSPNTNEPLRSPFILDIVFESSSGKIIDFDTLSIKCLKLVSLDLTGRIKPYLNDNRLTLKEVQVPQGRHCLQLAIAYASGEETRVEMVLNVGE
jgi:hypothetical protein